jgi:peroxiredoxin
MAAATATAASFSAAVRRLVFPTTLPSAAIRLRHVTTAARPNRLISSPTPPRHIPLLRVSATASPATATTLSVGDKLPDATLSYFDSDGELQTVTVSDLTKGKKAILFAVPGAFTPTCSQKHLPGFVEKAKELKDKGVDVIACVSVNDAFVMKAWKENLKVGDEVLLLSDGNGDFTKALGVEMDLSDKPVGLGVRSRRYALLAEDGVVKVLNLEEGGAFTNSSAEDMLKAL